MRNTGFIFEGMIEEASNRCRIADNIAIHAWLDPTKGKSIRWTAEFWEIIMDFDNKNVEIDEKSLNSEITR